MQTLAIVKYESILRTQTIMQIQNEQNQHQNQNHLMCTKQARAAGLRPTAHPFWVYAGCVVLFVILSFHFYFFIHILICFDYS